MCHTIHSFDAFFADELAVEKDDIISTVAEQTRWRVFFENYPFIVNENFDRIVRIQVKTFSYFDRKHYSSDLIKLSYNSGRFHNHFPPFYAYGANPATVLKTIEVNLIYNYKCYLINVNNFGEFSPKKQQN